MIGFGKLRKPVDVRVRLERHEAERQTTIAENKVRETRKFKNATSENPVEKRRKCKGQRNCETFQNPVPAAQPGRL